MGLIPWWAASLLANLCIMVVEYSNYNAEGTWTKTIAHTLPFIVVAQWGLFHAFSGAPNWMLAWCVFTLGNSIIRIFIVTLVAGDDIHSLWQVTGGVSVMLAGALLLKTGLACR